VIPAAPVLVWDCNSGGDPAVFRISNSPEVFTWVRQNIPEPVERCIYRIEFYILDGYSAVVYRYRRNEGGFRFRDDATGEAARAEPEHVLLSALPPRELWPDGYSVLAGDQQRQGSKAQAERYERRPGGSRIHEHGDDGPDRDQDDGDQDQRSVQAGDSEGNSEIRHALLQAAGGLPVLYRKMLFVKRADV